MAEDTKTKLPPPEFFESGTVPEYADVKERMPDSGKFDADLIDKIKRRMAKGNDLDQTLKYVAERGYAAINRMLRGGYRQGRTAKRASQHAIAKLDEAFARPEFALAKAEVFYRAVSAELADEFEKLFLGERLFKDDGYTIVANSFAKIDGPAGMEITVPKGEPMISLHKWRPGESLLNRGRTFQLIGKLVGVSGSMYRARVVPPDEPPE